MLMGYLGSAATVIIFLQMLEWEEEQEEKTSATATISTSVVGVLYPSLYEASPPPFPHHTHPTLYTSRLCLHPKRQLGQPVFTAEVIGVVRREPDRTI